MIRPMGFAGSIGGADYNPNVQKDGSFSHRQLWRFMGDVRAEPLWRDEAEKAYAFYDNDQYPRETLERMSELGIPPLQLNLCAPIIDSVSGWEAIVRTDLKVVPETEEAYAMAKALNVKMAEVQRLTHMNECVGDQFKETITIGISWLEIGRNPDPFEYPYLVRQVPWREMYMDYRARAADYSDARFICRRKWYDFDVLMKYFPGAKDEIEAMAFGMSWSPWNYDWDERNRASTDTANLGHSIEGEPRWSLEEDEWIQRERGRVALHEVLYWVPMPILVLRLRDGRTIELNQESQIHQRAVQAGMAKVMRGVAKQWRQAYYAGPARLSDIPIAGMPHYIPMVAYRKDSNGAPYGLMSRMISPQEAVNARMSRMLYDLISRKFFVSRDAVKDHQETAKELNKAMAYVVLESDRRMERGIEMVANTDASALVFQLFQEAKKNLFDVTGLHPEFLGRVSQATSGVAIERLVEQTSQVLGVVVDHYRSAKHAVGQRLMEMLVNDIGGWDDYEIEMEGGRYFMMNARRQDGERDNDVLMARIRVALSDTPATASYQQQKFQSLVEIVKSMPPEMQSMMIDLVVRAAALPDAEEILERIRSLTGFGPEPKDPEKREQLQMQQAQAQAMQEQVAALEMRLSESQAASQEARAQLDLAKAQKTQDADTALTQAKVLSELAQANAVPDETMRKERETRAKAVEAAARLRKEAMDEENREKGGLGDGRGSRGVGVRQPRP